MNTPFSAADLIALHAPEVAEPDRAQLAAAAELLAEVWPLGRLHFYADIQYDEAWSTPGPIHRHGFDRLCAGGERVVFFHKGGEWCLKAPRDCGYERANQREVAVLAALADADRALFARTIALPGDILLQRVYRIDPERFLAFERESRDITQAQRRLGVTDLNPVNVGWAEDGSWRFIDWAGTRQHVTVSLEPAWW